MKLRKIKKINNNVKKLLKCEHCGAHMIERTNDNILECLNCGNPYSVTQNINNEEMGSLLLQKMVLFGGCQVGFNTNPRNGIDPSFIEVNGEKIVCIAQGGECRYNHKYYSSGLNDMKSWTTPIIDKSCPNQCCYKVIVCDNHNENCEGSIRYYPQYNKFNGQFKRYCRNFEKYIK